ncbi:hypothetical protein V8C34DRAFT_298241 [Trichoderma compactum]
MSGQVARLMSDEVYPPSYCMLLNERVWIIDLLEACKTASYCRGPYSYESIQSQVDLIARTPGQTGQNIEKT